MKSDPQAQIAEQPPTWHADPVEEVLSRLETDPEGLSPAEVDRRLAAHGHNRLRPPRRRGPLERLLLQFHNILIYALLGAGFITALLGYLVDAGVIVGVVVINAVIGFVQEGRAEKALEAVRSMLSPQATVIRDGRRLTVPAEVLVPGDIVFVQSGDRVPADLRLLKVRDLRIEEAMLTGESVPVGKTREPARAEAPLGTGVAWPSLAPWSPLARAGA